MQKTNTPFVQGHKLSAKPRGKYKKTIAKEEAMRRVLDEQCRRERGIQTIDDILDIEKQKQVFALLYNKGIDSQDPNFKKRNIDVKALTVLADRILAKKQFVETKDTTEELPPVVIDVNILPSDYDSTKDPEAVHY